MEKTRWPRPRKLEYCVPPILVRDLTTQCAAHFFQWFRFESEEHVRDVRRCGLRGSGGLVEEVEWWFGCCKTSDAWDAEHDGPWVYDEVPVKDVADVVWKHTRGWSYQDFLDYGYTTVERDKRDAAYARAELKIAA